VQAMQHVGESLIQARERMVDPLAIRKLVAHDLAHGWHHVTAPELEHGLALAHSWVSGPLPPDGWPPTWRWGVGSLVASLHRARTGRPGSVLLYTNSIRAGLDFYDFHMAHSGRDPYEEGRVEVLGLLGRLLLDAPRPRDWELAILTRKAPSAAALAAGAAIMNLRQAQKMSRAELGQAVKRDRGTIRRWELGLTHPDAEERQLLAHVLNGHASDF
jgi:DNA-binding transcriptional regulator YiaG